jgi:pyruvate, water dikinase
VEQYILKLDELGMGDVERVGGKNASLGEMLANLDALGVTVPDGFATTAAAYRDFMAQDGLADRIRDVLAGLDVEDVEKLVETGAAIRQWIKETPLQPKLHDEIRRAWDEMARGKDIAVAVRSSATAEDLPEASFAGQQETYLNVRGIDQVIERIHDVFASLFNDRAIAYRVHHEFDHNLVALSAGIQHMVRSDTGASGVLFTLDTESGFRDVVFITASWGLGEMVVQGAVNPDEFYVFKPSLAAGKRAILRKTLGSKALKMVHGDDGHGTRTVGCTGRGSPPLLPQRRGHRDAGAARRGDRAHYGCPMDIEWGKDGADGKLYILQARPETVQSRQGRSILRFKLKDRSTIIASGRSIGQRIGAGTARIIRNVKEMHRVQPGDVLIADMTDPDWEPVMKRSAAIVTNRGGRTCHAAIIARELGIPAVVGCGDATATVPDGRPVTVSCAEGDTGFIFDGVLDYEEQTIELDRMPEIPLKIMMNVGNPDRAFDFAGIPHHGVGLARLEFIINRMIGVHPRALLEFDTLNENLRHTITQQMAGYDDPVGFFVDKLAEGISTIGAAFAPHPVIVRLSDFKSNEYANLIGGRDYEPHEENPMLGFRGASRYVAESFRPCFELECQALKRVREDMGLENVQVMVPFVRTVGEAARSSAAGRQRPDARRTWPQADHDVRDSVERPAGRAVPRAFRRHVDRLERHDAAHAGPRSRLEHHCRLVR